MKLQRILVVSEPGIAGVFLIVRRLIRFFHTHHPEITVDFAYSSWRQWQEFPGLLEEVKSHGGEVIDLQVRNNPGPRDLIALFKLWRFVRRRSPQLVHAHSSKAGGLCRLLAGLPGFPPVLYTPHAFYGMAGRGGIKEKFYNILERVLGRAGTTQVVVMDERRFARETLKLPPHSLVLISTGIEAEQFVPVGDETQKAAARARLGIPREGKLLVTTGRESAQKNYPPLYAAVNRFLAGHPAFFFAHAGVGALKRREEIDAANRPRCFCFEHLADVRDLLWAADGFILTSLYEAPSLSMLEALSCGLPLLLTDAPGFSRLRALGLEVDWMPDPTRCANFEEEILKIFKAWYERPPVLLLDQHDFALRNCNSTIQSEKVVRLYEWLVRRRNS